MEKRYIASLHIGQNSGAAGIDLQSGEVFAVSEERFSRKKNDIAFPMSSIQAVLKHFGINEGQIDEWALAGRDPNITPYWLAGHDSYFSIKDCVREQNEFWYPRLYENNTSLRFLDLFSDKVKERNVPAEQLACVKDGDKIDLNLDVRVECLKKLLNVDKRKITFYHHNESHAIYAYYGCRPPAEDKVLVFVVEGWGDDCNASVSVFDKGFFKVLYKTPDCYLGRLYRYITLLLGMHPNEHEYKVMGLAPYAVKKIYEEALDIFRSTMYVDGLGFAYHTKPRDCYFWFRDRFQHIRFDGIAGALQKYVEEVLCQWVCNWIKHTGIGVVRFGGGVAMNIKAMMEIGKLECVNDIQIPPTPADDSLPLSACYYAMHQYAHISKKIYFLKHAYIGPSYADEEESFVIKTAQEIGNYIIIKTNPAIVAKLLAQGKVLGRCVGAMEFGARALGNRSILAHPSFPDIIKKLNHKIKQRDFWMPFAPVIMDRSVSRYIHNKKLFASPYMTIAFETTPQGRREIWGALHQADNTARAQILSREDNPELYDIIDSFEALTGIGALINTSFNLHGEPIVFGPKDAFDVLQRSGLDGIILNHHIVLKKYNSNEP